MIKKLFVQEYRKCVISGAFILFQQYFCWDMNPISTCENFEKITFLILFSIFRSLKIVQESKCLSNDLSNTRYLTGVESASRWDFFLLGVLQEIFEASLWEGACWLERKKIVLDIILCYSACGIHSFPRLYRNR